MPAYRRPVVAFIMVRRIVDRPHPRLRDDGNEFAFPAIEQRAQQRYTDIERPRCPDPREARQAGPASQPQQQRLCLIVGMMSGGEPRDALAAAPVRHQAVSRLACRRLKVRAWLGTVPAQRRMRDAETRADRGDAGRFIGALRAQAVIDRHGADAKPERLLRQHQQRQAVGAARDGKAERLLVAERPPDKRIDALG